MTGLAMKALMRSAVVLLVAATLGGCAVLVFGAAAGVATSFRQERTVEDQLNDMAIQTDLEARLVQADGKLFKAVNTTVIEGRVYLKGKVPDYDSRLRATRVAWITPGVNEVYNDILVGEEKTLEGVADDTWISTKVRASLIDKAAIKDVNYTIETQNGVVYLMGIAQDAAERAVAIEATRSVAGVVGVVDYLVLKDDPRRGVASAEAPSRDDGNGEAPGTYAPYDAQSRPTPIEVRPAGS